MCAASACAAALPVPVPAQRAARGVDPLPGQTKAGGMMGRWIAWKEGEGEGEEMEEGREEGRYRGEEMEPAAPGRSRTGRAAEVKSAAVMLILAAASVVLVVGGGVAAGHGQNQNPSCVP